MNWFLWIIALSGLSLVACGKVTRTPVVQINDALFLEGDSVILCVRHNYVWYEETGPLVVGSDMEKGRAQILKYLGSSKQVVLDIPSLGDSYVGIEQILGDTLVYVINSTNNPSSRTYFRDLGSGGLTNSYKSDDGGAYRMSYGSSYIFNASRVRDFDGEAADGFERPAGSRIVFLEDINRKLVILDRQSGLAFWDPSTKNLDPIKEVSGRITWFYADGGEVLVFKEVEGLRGAIPTYYYTRVSNLLEGKKIFQSFTIPPEYNPVDVSLAEGSVLASKVTDYDESDDTLRVFDMAGNLKWKISGEP